MLDINESYRAPFIIARLICSGTCSILKKPHHKGRGFFVCRVQVGYLKLGDVLFTFSGFREKF